MLDMHRLFYPSLPGLGKCLMKTLHFPLPHKYIEAGNLFLMIFFYFDIEILITFSFPFLPSKSSHLLATLLQIHDLFH